nr:MAG: sulfatase [Bacteroidota bacterium]
MRSLQITVVVILILTVVACFRPQEEVIRPNVVFILVDDLGWLDLGFMGSTAYETPNVDRLASEGMIFTNFCSGGPVCSPTRASIMTGKSTARTGITAFLITPDQDPPYVTHQLELSEFTIAEAFREHGYRTGLFGKWHLGYDSEHWAANQGFEVAIGGTTSKNAWKMLHPDREPPVDQLEVRYFSPHYLTHMEDGSEGEYLTDRLTNETIRFIEEHRDERFFAFLSFHTVHTPLEVKEEVRARYEAKFRELGTLGLEGQEFGSRKCQNLPEYAAMVHHMDENVGRLLRRLSELGLDDNTIVVFTSDNGGKGSVTSMAPLRGAKHDLYEGGIRVPLIVRWPGKIRPRSRSDWPLISDDFYPTLLDLAGLPLRPEQHIDGRSFKPILLEESSTINRDALFWHYPHGVFQGAVRQGNMKLVYHYQTGKAELFDLEKDPGERNDISESNSDVVIQMKAMLREWLKETNARFPEEGVVIP